MNNKLYESQFSIIDRMLSTTTKEYLNDVDKEVLQIFSDVTDGKEKEQKEFKDILQIVSEVMDRKEKEQKELADKFITKTIIIE